MLGTRFSVTLATIYYVTLDELVKTGGAQDEAMDTLIYKRTHTGDPNKSGVFGVHDCMGRVRHWNFDAVIGVGGKNPWRRHKDIAYRINWIGVNPTKTDARKRRWKGPLVTFERFVLYDEIGPKLKKLAPKVFKYLFEDRHVRVVMSRSLPDGMQKEITRILKHAKKYRRTRRSLSKTVLSKHKC